MPLVIRFGAYELPDGLHVWSESVSADDRVSGYRTRIGGALVDGSTRNSRTVNLEWRVGRDSPDDLQTLLDELKTGLGENYNWLQLNDGRVLWCKPSTIELEYPDTVMTVARAVIRFVAPDPRWISLETTTEDLVPRERVLQGSAAIENPGSADAETRVDWMVSWDNSITEHVTGVKLVNRYQNLVWNADFEIQTRSYEDTGSVTFPKLGLADNWDTDRWMEDRYRPWLEKQDKRQHLQIVSPTLPQDWETWMLIPYKPALNLSTPEEAVLGWRSAVEFTRLEGNWMFHLTLRALQGLDHSATALHTATSPVVGSVGGVDFPVTGPSWSGVLGCTLAATLSTDVEALEVSFVFSSVTGPGATLGHGVLHLGEPRLRSDGVTEFVYTPHRSVVLGRDMELFGPRLEFNLSEFQVSQYQQKSSAVNALQYIEEESQMWELVPGVNNLHWELSGTFTSVTAPCRLYNQVVVEQRPRWWT
jgi:hypothetical protein